MVLGIIFGPLYYGYCVYLSGRTGETLPMTERAERWVAPDGTIMRFRGGLGHKPVSLALAPDMNLITLRLRFELRDLASAKDPMELQYQATLFDGTHAVLDRSVRVTLKAGHARTTDIGPLTIPYAGDYLFVLEEVGRIPVTPGVSLSIVEKVDAPNMPVVWTGLVLLVVAFVIQLHALWTARSRRPGHQA
jgi:hypothetical protein